MPRTDGAGAQNRDWPESLVGVFRHFKIYAEANAKKDSRFFRGGVFAALSLASVFVFAPENLGWNPTANGIGRNIMRDDTVCPDNAIFSNRYAIANEDIRPDPHIIANNDIIAERGHRSFILEMKLMPVLLCANVDIVTDRTMRADGDFRALRMSHNEAVPSQVGICSNRDSPFSIKQRV